jgi:hypothetical protein
VVRRAELRLRSGYRQQPGKLIVADLGLGDQNTAVEMLELAHLIRQTAPERLASVV